MPTSSRSDIQIIERCWIQFDEYKKKLKYREWELLNEHKETDTNNGGERSNNISNPTERKAIVLAEDKLYQKLKDIVKTIEEIYSQLDSDLKIIVDMRYWDTEKNCYAWEDIADRLYISRNKVLRKQCINR